jgi:predicted histidine transporter YuiF (NhaC family)
VIGANVGTVGVEAADAVIGATSGVDVDVDDELVKSVCC